MRAAVGLGSNVGARELHLERACERLAALPGTCLLAASPWFETEPVGGPPGQGLYLNGVALLDTELSAAALLDALLAIERDAGRVRVEGVRAAPRTLDLDLLLFGLAGRDAGARIELPHLRVPHPRLEERLFVLEPLRAVAPGLVLPSGVPIDARIDALRGAARPETRSAGA